MRRWLELTFAATAIMQCGLTAMAAQYKWVGADGRINYSDRQPAQDTRVLDNLSGAVDAEPAVNLPYALRQLSDRYPVTLYTASSCGPCDSARSQLIQRGVPFTEYTVGTKADSDAYQKAGFDGKTVPGIQVGRQRTSGYEASAIHSLLDAAGYPKASKLPASYKRAMAKPLTTPSVATAKVDANSGIGDSTSASASAAAQTLQARSGTDAALRTKPPKPVPAVGANPNFRF